MKHKVLRRSISILFLLALLLGLTVALPGKSLAAQASQAKQGNADGGGGATAASDEALQKYDDALQEIAKAGGEDEITVRLVTEKEEVTWPDYVMALPRALPDEASGGVVWFARLKADYLAKLAGLDVVIEASLVQAKGPVPRFLPEDKTVQPSATILQRLQDAKSHGSADNTITTDNGINGWWDVAYGHLSAKAWGKGFTGDGVTVADIDSGVDFCHPDLYGTWKTYSVSTSRNYTYGGVANYLDYYDRWPVASSPVSNYFLLLDMLNYGEMTDDFTFLYSYTKFADTRATGTGSTISFDGIDWTTTGSAFSGTEYHIGYHPDYSLEVIYGERIGVLVVDEDGDGVYESVYVDLDNDKDFSDEAVTNKKSPTACWDFDGDNYFDISGGLVYFIADGLHWPQTMDWYWNPVANGVLTAPGNGDLVAFMFDDPYGPAEAHGTLTASAIVGQGEIDGDPQSVGGEEIRPSWKSSSAGGMVQGAGMDAKIIAIGDSYINHEMSTEEAWYFSVWGVDGYGDTNDGAQISSNSYGSSDTDNDEWDDRSRLLTRLNIRTTSRGGYSNVYGQQHAFVFSTGNGGSGYGTNAPPSGSTAIAVGASTQMGSTAWDSISGPDQIVWGDVIPFSNRGPTAMASPAPAVTADGAFAAGDLSLNSWMDGWTAWETWGGTSRSAPVAAGNLALIYDAFMQSNSRYPTWEEARELLMSGATNQDYDVFTQGAGMVNADKATDIAGGIAGLQASPSSWTPGDYQGDEFVGFAKMLQPGDTDSNIFTLTNYSTTLQSFAVKTSSLTEISSFEFALDAVTSKESDYDFNRPDYLFDVSKYAPGGAIPAGTVLMEAEVIQPFDEWELDGDENYTNNDNWRILWYSWTDIDTNNALWTDINHNGAVNTREIDSGEYVRFSMGYNYHTYHSVFVKDPLDSERWKDGIYLGLQHRTRPDDTGTTHLTLRVTFYQKSACDWLTVSTPGGTDVAGNSTGNFNANVSAPSDMPYGLYECAIELTSNNNVSSIPVVLNVAYSGDLTTDVVTLGGEAKSDEMYDNSYMTGPADWSWREEAGDWRFYFLDQTTVPDDGSYLIVRDEWDDVAPETDFDTIILGPSLDVWSYYYPTVFGPYSLYEYARSTYNNLGSGVWGFDTTTGSNVEYVAAPLESDGLHEVMQHSVRYEGDKFDVGFEKTLSSINGPSASDLTYTYYFTDSVSFTTSLTHTTGITVEVYGIEENGQDFSDVPIVQDPTEDNVCDFESGGIYTYTTILPANLSDFLAYVSVGGYDLDLFVYYDADNNGKFACPGERVKSSTNPSGEDDYVDISFPDAGNYLVAIQGYGVGSSSGTFDWYWESTALNNNIAFRNADLTLNPSHPATFELYNVNPDACNPTKKDCDDGILYVGFPEAPHLFSIPITVNFTNAYFLPFVMK
jgi:hypothetical protein